MSITLSMLWGRHVRRTSRHSSSHQHRSLLQSDIAQISVVASLRSDLFVPVSAHRKALVRLLTSSHTLAVEVLRRAERCCPPVPRDQRSCRYCPADIEHQAHALLYCSWCNVEVLRYQFFPTKVFRIFPDALETSSLRFSSSSLDGMQLLIEGTIRISCAPSRCMCLMSFVSFNVWLYFGWKRCYHNWTYSQEVSLLRETYAAVRSQRYEPPWEYLRAVDPGIPDYRHTHHLITEFAYSTQPNV